MIRNKYYKQSYKGKITLLSCLMIIFIASSCSKNWNCGSQDGFKCKSISDIDNEIESHGNQKESSGRLKGAIIGREQEEKGKRSKNNKINEDILIQSDVNAKESKSQPISSSNFTAYPKRTREKIGRILILPYSDNKGYFHSGKYIYMLDEEAQWRVNLDSKAMN